MKIECRGKYPGVKLHLEPKECEVFREWVEGGGEEGDYWDTSLIEDISTEIGTMISDLLKKTPTLYEERTEEEITNTLMKEFVESEKKLARIKDGLDWKKVKVEVVK